MPVDARMLVWIVVATTLLFTVVIMSGLRVAKRNQARALRDTRASKVLAEIGLCSTDLPALLYGLWQTSLAQSSLHVRDGNDVEVARITHAVQGAGISVGSDRYRVLVTSGWRERAALLREGDDDTSAALCTFELRGWGGRRLATYTLADGRVLTIRAHWSIARQRRPLPIVQDGRVTGQLFALGGPTSNTGRALLLPPAIPLPIRLFILYKAVGSRVASPGPR